MYPHDIPDNKRVFPSELMMRIDKDIWREYQISDTFADLLDRLSKDFNQDCCTGTAYLIEGIFGSGRTALLYAIEKMITCNDEVFSKYCLIKKPEAEILNRLIALRNKQIAFIHSHQSKEGLLEAIQKTNGNHREIIFCDDVSLMIREDIHWLTTFVRDCKRKNTTLLITSFLINRLHVFDMGAEKKFAMSFDKVFQVERPLQLPSKHFVNLPTEETL